MISLIDEEQCVIDVYRVLEDENRVLSLWRDIRSLVEEVDFDVHKNANENVSAGIRVRKKLRLLASMSHELVKLTIDFDKSTKKSRREKRGK